MVVVSQDRFGQYREELILFITFFCVWFFLRQYRESGTEYCCDYFIFLGSAIYRVIVTEFYSVWCDVQECVV